MDGALVIIFNVYAPSAFAERELLYAHLAQLNIHAGTQVQLGCDFNCTFQGSTDGMWKTEARHMPPALVELCLTWGIVECLEDKLARLASGGLTAGFAADHTTFSRLDRWYVSRAHADWIRRCHTLFPARSESQRRQYVNNQPGHPGKTPQHQGSVPRVKVRT